MNTAWASGNYSHVIGDSEWVENYYYERSGVRAILAKLTSQDSLLKTGQGDWTSLEVGMENGGGRCQKRYVLKGRMSGEMTMNMIGQFLGSVCVGG